MHSTAAAVLSILKYLILHVYML